MAGSWKPGAAVVVAAGAADVLGTGLVVGSGSAPANPVHPAVPSRPTSPRNDSAPPTRVGGRRTVMRSAGHSPPASLARSAASASSEASVPPPEDGAPVLAAGPESDSGASLE